MRGHSTAEKPNKSSKRDINIASKALDGAACTNSVQRADEAREEEDAGYVVLAQRQ
jgi:hypothetical protein